MPDGRETTPASRIKHEAESHLEMAMDTDDRRFAEDILVVVAEHSRLREGFEVELRHLAATATKLDHIHSHHERWPHVHWPEGLHGHLDPQYDESADSHQEER